MIAGFHCPNFCHPFGRLKILNLAIVQASYNHHIGIVVIGYIVGVSILRNKGAVLRLFLPPHSFPLLSILGTMNRIPSFLTLIPHPGYLLRYPLV